ncbi:MAG: ABC transporter ATP-binding protein [Anaerolineae bacterium]|nr:ABC transporter ATP-binding protein [Anaerolineae bacterium]
MIHTHQPNPAEDGFIRLRAVDKIFKLPSGEFHALSDINLTIQRGEFVTVVGKSGSGKSTLINMIAGIDRPSNGTIQVNGADLNQLNESRLSVWRGRNLGVVFQFFQLLPMLSVLENVLLPMDFAVCCPEAERVERAMSLLDLVGLVDVAEKLPAALSGGQQQCAAIARALANEPPVLVADEPTGNLDSRTAERVMGIFDTLLAQHKTVIMVTHDRSLAARATRRLVISDGSLVLPAISESFPDLPHTAMLALTKALKPAALRAGEAWQAPAGVKPGLVLVEDGEFQLRGSRQRSLKAGQWLSLPDRLPASTTLHCIKDGTLAWLGEDDLRAWLAQTPGGKSALTRRGGHA